MNSNPFWTHKDSQPSFLLRWRMPLHKGHIFLDYTFSTSSVSPVETSEEKTGRQRCQADPDANFEQAGWAVCLQMNPRFLSPIDTQRERFPLQKTAPVDFCRSPELAAALLQAARRLRFRKPDLRTRQHPSELIPKKSSGKDCCA